MVTVSISLVLAASMSACSDSSKPGNGMTDLAGVKQEYKDTISSLRFPSSYPPPPELEGETAASFQKGWGNTRASNIWECSWQKEWLANYSSNKKKAAAAIAELEKAPSMTYMSPAVSDDSTRRYFKQIMDKAKLGDPSGFQESVKANCD